ncbi:M23 family metallopeptidase [Brucepastera parasyntrophica]|uniref:M23 family metallopeptidase n=1 Tax=Brucepastera parasyntrophica TaxID=2880008 RepID=UPI002109931F|nr:M23 family metallopeptidase [Brucepastera parasyntrophica]ULQ59670.1 M23 family metallopeptidase [Brucepastera parasyntrophica]
MLLYALEWPVLTPYPSRLFGQRSSDVMERGVILENVDNVRAAGHGTVLITLTPNANMSGFPGTLGNTVILAHDDGIMTIYGNLDSVDLVDERIQIESGSILASAGTSGWGNRSSCIFQVVDQIQKTVLNPLLLLPALQDTRPPSLRNIIAVSDRNQVFPLGTVKSLRQGKYRIYGDISDTINNNTNELSVFRITVLVNGSEYSVLAFETMKENEGRLYLSSPEFTGETLYTDPARTFLGEINLIRGKADISVIARDMAGNERSVLFGLQIE